MLVQVYEAASHLKVGNQISLVYPSSKTGEPTPRSGRVEKVTADMVVVELPNGEGYRSFKFSRIIGGIEVS